MELTCDVSIIIVNWNTRAVLRDCIQSILEQTRMIAYEIIVVDNASSDHSTTMIREQFPEVILIENDDNRGFAAANNQGLRRARGRYLLLLNSDTVILDGAIQKTVHYADTHEQYAVVGCQVWESPTVIQKTCFRFHTPWNFFCVNSGLSKLFPKSPRLGGDKMQEWDRTDEREVDVVSGMYMLVRREVVEQVGELDESFFVYCEEADWCYRIKLAGWKNVFWPGARIIHLDGGNKSTDQVNVKMSVQLIKSILIYLRKHFGYGSYLLTRVITLILAATKLTCCVLLWPLKPKRSAPRITKFFAIVRYLAFDTTAT